ncbi:MAG: recombinase family protein [Methanomassiliicoccales archaeon]|nr:recombinase family protein [Methanomassiliicoccales archaeon]
MPRVAIYTRVSTEDQAREGFSLEAQRERLLAYCEAQGWDLAEMYEDDGHSGRNTRRPAYRRMLDERERWDVILVMKMDRIHRNSKNFMIMMEDLEKWGKKFTSMNESLDTSTAVGRFVVDIIQRIAQLESEQIGERTYMGMRQKAESGAGLTGFNIPYGYHFEKGKLVQSPEESCIVSTVFQSYLEGKTMDWIAWDLNRSEVRTKMGGQWSVWSISRMLHNPLYAGAVRWDGLLRPSDHEPVISVDTFNRVQVRISSKVKNPRSKAFVRLPEHLDAVLPIEGLVCLVS